MPHFSIVPADVAMTRFRPGIRAAGLVAAVFLPWLAAAAAPQPDRVIGPEPCAECHIQEIEVWKLTKHFKSGAGLHQRPESLDIARRLGLGDIRQDTGCQACHYLSQTVGNVTQVMSGVSCESCHGAARDWVKGHADYGQGVTAATESPEHRAARRSAAEAHGLIRPDDFYSVGQNCYTCHILQDEKLVNVGGHTPGKEGFNLLTWTQGEVRHNIHHTGDKANPEAPPADRRRLFAVGCVLEVEYAFRAVAHATQKEKFGLTYARRADVARKQLEKIQALAPTPELASIIKVANATGLRLNHAEELTAAAEEVARLGREFATKVSGEQLAAIDAILPGPESYEGTPYHVMGSP